MDVTNAVLHKLEQFGPLAQGDRDVLMRLCAGAFAVGPRTEIAREGERPTGLFVLIEGMACRYKLGANGTRQILAYMVPGDFCDLDVALLDRRDHAIASVSACRFARIAFEALDGLAEARSPLLTTMRRAVLMDDATLREWLVNLGSRSAIERIAHLFLELLVRLQTVGLARADGYDLPMSQLDLGETTGLSAVHVNRTLQDLKRQGLIELHARALTIRDIPGLTKLSGFNPEYLRPGSTTA